MDHDPSTNQDQPATMSPPPVGGHQQPLPLSQIALWSMILGIIGLCIGPLGLVALIMGIIGITKTSGVDARPGRGFAIAGTVLGAVALVGSCLYIAILLPALGQARQAANELKSQTQLRSIGQGMMVYASSNNDRFPPVDETFDILLDWGLVEEEILVSPLEDGDGVSYILVGVEEVSYSAYEIIAYEDPDHLRSGVNVLFADMHVERMELEEFEALLAEQEARRKLKP